MPERSRRTRRERMDENAREEISPWTEGEPDLARLAFTLWTRIPANFFEEVSPATPEAMVNFARNYPEKAQAYIERARVEGIIPD